MEEPWDGGSGQGRAVEETDERRASFCCFSIEWKHGDHEFRCRNSRHITSPSQTSRSTRYIDGNSCRIRKSPSPRVSIRRRAGPRRSRERDIPVGERRAQAGTAFHCQVHSKRWRAAPYFGGCCLQRIRWHKRLPKGPERSPRQQGHPVI